LAHEWIIIFVRLQVIYFLYSDCNSSYTVYCIDFTLFFCTKETFQKGIYFFIIMTLVPHWVKCSIFLHLEISVFRGIIHFGLISYCITGSSNSLPDTPWYFSLWRHWYFDHMVFRSLLEPLLFHDHLCNKQSRSNCQKFF
jgi:hypothetical protein